MIVSSHTLWIQKTWRLLDLGDFLSLRGSRYAQGLVGYSILIIVMTHPNFTSTLPTFLWLSDGYVLMIIITIGKKNIPIVRMHFRSPKQTIQAHLFPIAFTNNNCNMLCEWLICASSAECRGDVYHTLCHIVFVNDHFRLPKKRICTCHCLSHNFFFIEKLTL